MNISVFKNNNRLLINILIIFIVSLSLVVVWFRKGLLLGGGEAGLAFYNPGGSQNLVSFAWRRGLIGGASGIALVSVLFYWFAQALVTLSFSQAAVQSLYFFLLLFAGGLGVLFLTKEIFGQKGMFSVTSLIAALFYTLNPMSLMGVWHRFQYPFMFFYALMPIALCLFIKGLKNQALVYAFFLNIVCLIFSMAFVSFPLVELFWSVIGFYFLFYLLTNWQDKKSVIFALKFFFFTLILWVLLNLWWLLQFLNTLFATEFITTQAVTKLGDIWTFKGISELLGRFLYLFRFIHKTYFEELIEVWGPIYFSSLFLILGFLVPIFTFGSLLIKKKPKLYWYFVWLSILGLFLAKGSAPPLGQVFLFAFSRFRPLAAFRNPFEKIGLILPLGFAPLFALGLISFYSWLKKFSPKFTVCLLPVACCLLFVVYMFPMWNRWVFTSTSPPADNLEIGNYVKVPEYYQEASQWLNKERTDFRAVALPIKGEGITYDWEYGYGGIELSSTLFDKPFISLITTIPYLNEIVSPLEDFFLEHTQRFYKLMGILNSKYLMVRSDIDYELRGMRSPEVIRERLEGVRKRKEEKEGEEDLKLVEKFGELEFYKTPDDLFVPHFYVAGSSSFVDKNLQNPYLPLSFDEFKLRETVFSPQGNNNLPLDLSRYVYVSAQPHPKQRMQASQLGTSRYLPGSKLYPFVQWKEKRLEKEVLAAEDLEGIIDLNLGLANKRLGEIERLTKARNEKKEIQKNRGRVGQDEEIEEKQAEILIRETWEKFKKRLNKALELLRKAEDQNEDVSEIAYRVLEYVKLFQGRFVNLTKDEDFQTGLPVKLESLLKIRQWLEEKAWVGSNTLEKRYLAEVPKGGEYELFVNAEDAGRKTGNADVDTDNIGYLGGLFKENPFKPLTFALDGKTATVSGKERKDNWLSFGKHRLEEGKHKLQVFLPRFVNLARQESFILSAKKGESFVLPFDDFLDKGGDFNISFDYKIEGEGLPRIVVAQRIKIEEGKDVVQKLANVVLPKSEYQLQFIKSFKFDPRAERAGITIFFEEYGDAKLRVENFQVTRDWRPEIVFRAITDSVEERNAGNAGIETSASNIKRGEGESGKQGIPRITFQRVNPTRHEVWVEEATEPYLLVFSESHHPGWRVYIDSKTINTSGDRISSKSINGEVLTSYFGGGIKELEHRDDFVYKGMFDIWGRKEIVPQERHLLVNGYANSWYIRPEDVGGKESYKLIIEFWPQRLFYIGLFVSGVTLIGCVGCLFIIKRLKNF